MNSLTALFLWLLSQMAPSDVVCAKYELPPEVCEAEAGPAEDEQRQTTSRRDAPRDEGERRVRAERAPSSATRISNGF